jgi:hypothetical protein
MSTYKHTLPLLMDPVDNKTNKNKGAQEHAIFVEKRS